MGSNDAAEMLEVAKEECGRLEREVAALKSADALAEKHWHRDQADLALVVAERDKAIAERDASRQVNAEFLAARADMARHDAEIWADGWHAGWINRHTAKAKFIDGEAYYGAQLPIVNPYRPAPEPPATSGGDS
jgi:hypothetical protein